MDMKNRRQPPTLGARGFISNLPWVITATVAVMVLGFVICVGMAVAGKIIFLEANAFITNYEEAINVRD